MSRQKIIIFPVLIGLTFFLSTISFSYGHGVGFEVLPPVNLGDKQVSLEITSAQYLDPDSMNRQFTFSLFDISNGVTIKDVTYHIIAKKTNDFIFEETFQSDNGILSMNFLPSESESITIEKEAERSFTDLVLGIEKKVVNIKGSAFSTGGLYNFQVKILTAERYSNELEEPIVFNAGLSIPDRTYYDIEDPNFGNQEVSVVTYYDQIKNFQYDPQTQSITFKMPFDWSFDNINQTTIVHEEIVIPKTFGDLMISKFLIRMNNFEVPEHTITIDDFSEKNRILHVMLNQKDLFLLDSKQESSNEMNFLIKPAEANLPLATVTGNGQFRISLSWEPAEIKSGSKIVFSFDITDVFLKDRPVAVSYDLSIIHQGKEIFSTSGVSTDSKEKHNVLEFLIPEDISGPITLQFDNLDGNGLARVGIPVVVNRINTLTQNGVSDEILIPDWVRNNAGWWSEGQISDNDFAGGIEFLIKEKVIRVPVENSETKLANAIIPDWLRNNANWWSQGLISDKEFANGLQYLIQNGIISV